LKQRRKEKILKDNRRKISPKTVVTFHFTVYSYDFVYKKSLNF